MTDLEKAARMALEALEDIFGRNKVDVGAITALLQALEQPAQQEPEFIKHEVKNADDWSEWVCPDPKGYQMKCCDCGLVHEAQFGVVRYKSENEREDCEKVDDPNLQAVFRMRRSEQWSPEDTAHRAGGLPMEQPAQQEPVAWPEHEFIQWGAVKYGPLLRAAIDLLAEVENNLDTKDAPQKFGVPFGKLIALRAAIETSPQPSKPWVGLTGDEISECWGTGNVVAAVEAKLKDKNA